MSASTTGNASVTASGSAADLIKRLQEDPANNQAILAGASVLDTILHHAVHPHAVEADLMRNITRAVVKPEFNARSHIWSCEDLNLMDLDELDLQTHLLRWFQVGLQLLKGTRNRVEVALYGLQIGLFEGQQESDMMDFVHQMVAATTI
ncbi:hypothetical protein PYCCODRAFT_1437179 [Trametes coccinea BRFM310]|uniref:Uncharacterized protein n=1 Tax=Trametes coccinea (strain BRFM310) TaxID=1353009 RepID=A0A1Y2IK41_TRAC3|nr:hypothetical protein PYCCODRAFT_1437179 [Trametes coccinea BRFM310]